MLSTKEVVAKVDRLRTRYAARDQRMRDVLSVLWVIWVILSPRQNRAKNWGLYASIHI